MGSLQSLLRRRSAVLNPLPPDATVEVAVTRMAERHVGIVPVVADGRLIGVFSERDLLRRVVARGLPPAATPLRDVMTPDPATAHPSEPRQLAIQKMKERGCRHLPILEQGTLVDVLSMRDLLYAELAEKDGEIQALQQYIQGA
jgi:CBS domain-containing protein